MVGTTVQHYEILELIGRGAMGTVYKARDTRLDILRALKFLQPVLSDMSFAQAHLLREARTQAKLLHPNVAALLELEVTDEWTFLVLEYVDGPTLDVYLAESRPPLKERFNLVLQVTCALEAAHSRGILHRDIKPKNVLIASDGTAKVTDFGLAKALGQTTLTMSGETKGTAPYMAPEAFRGEATGATADVWSLGVLAYEALEDKLPFEGDSFEAVAYQIVTEPHPPLSKKVEETLPGMSEFVDTCLTKNAKDRLADATETFLALTEIATNAGISSSVQALSIPRIHRRKRVKALYRRATIALLGIAILTGAILSRSIRSTRYIELENLPPIGGDVAVTWDKAGQRLALIMEKGTSDLFILETIAHAEPQPITLSTEATFRHLKWSPNDTAIALTGDGGIYLYDNVREKLWQIGDHPTEDCSWSEDSRWIIYANLGESGALERIGPIDLSSDSLHIIPPELLEITGLDHLGGSLRLHDPTYILGDTRIAFRIERIAEHLGISTIPAEGGEAQPLIDREVSPYSLDWNEKKRELIFHSRGEKPGIYKVKVKRGGMGSGRMRALRIGSGVADFDFHPETGRIVLLTTLLDQQIWRISISAEGDSTDRVITDAFCPSISNDGRELFYVDASSESGVQLRVRELSSGLNTNLVDYHPRIKHECYPAPSPDGRHIVFQAFSLDSTYDLWLYDRNRHDFTQLTFDSAEESDPVWAADWKSIYYVWKPDESGSQSQIRQLSVNRVDGNIEAGSCRIFETGGRPRCPRSSADGRFILYQDSGTLFIMDTADQEERKELVPGRYPALSPSRNDVYYIRDNRLYRITDWTDSFIRTPEEEMVTPFPDNVAIYYNGPPLTVGDNVVYVVYTIDEEGDLKVLEPDR